MKEWIYQLFSQSNDLAVEQIALQIVVAALLGLAICISYRFTHTGAVYSRKFNITLLTLAVLTATVMTVIGNNIALSLGMVGALSIVRFRTAIKDARDTAYIFWTIIVGICCGVGDYVVAAIGSGVVFILLLIFGRLRNDDRLLLIIRAARSEEVPVEGLISEYYNYRARLRVKNTTKDSLELIYELTRTLSDKAEKNAEKPITDALYGYEGVEYVNLVVQNDEIGS